VGSPAAEHDDERECRAGRRHRRRSDVDVKIRTAKRKIFVSADTPIVIYELGDRADLKPGAKVFIVAVKQLFGTAEPSLYREPPRCNRERV
jgi:hypothetical protein